MAKKHRGIDESKIKHYLKDGGDSKGRFIPLTNSLMLSKRFQNLTPMARWMFLCLAMEAGGSDTARLSHTGAKKYGINSSSYDNAIKQLKDNGFIKLEENIGRLETNAFRFIYDWHFKPP